jgi:hypothetical protein
MGARSAAAIFSGFRPLALAAVLFLIPNITVFLAVSLRPEILEALWLSVGTPRYPQPILTPESAVVCYLRAACASLKEK